MALMATMQRQAIQEAVDQWRDRCLVGDGSLLFEGEQVWTHDNLVRLYGNVIGDPRTDARTFMEKFREQLGEDRGLVLLGAEALAVYYLIADGGQ
jgi:5-methylcytosine-specific restriction enzyme B